MPKFFTCNEVAEIFRRTPQTIWRWIGEGYIKEYSKVKDGYLIPEREVKRIIEEKNAQDGAFS